MTADAIFFDLLRRAANAVRDAKALTVSPDVVCVIHPSTLAQVRLTYVAGYTIAGEPVLVTDEQMLGRPLLITTEQAVGKLEYLSHDEARKRFPVAYHQAFPTKE